MAGASCVHERGTRRRLLSGSPLRRFYRGETWASQIPGSSSSCVPWSYTPPDADFPRLLPIAKTAVAFRKFRPLGSRNAQFSRPHSPRPTRSRAYASPAASPRPSQGSLPAGAAYPFAGQASHPLDDNPNFMSSSHHPFPSDQPVLVALKGMSSSQFRFIMRKAPDGMLALDGYARW